MSNSKLDDILERLCTCSGQESTKSGHYENVTMICTYFEAKATLSKIVNEAIPAINSVGDEVPSGWIRTGYNQAIYDFRANLKERGIL